jgi:hypothetical protein
MPWRQQPCPCHPARSVIASKRSPRLASLLTPRRSKFCSCSALPARSWKVVLSACVRTNGNVSCDNAYKVNFIVLLKTAHLQDLQKVEEPFLEEILKCIEHKMTVGDIRVGEHGLIGKVARVVRLYYETQRVHLPQLALLLTTASDPPIGQSSHDRHTLVTTSAADTSVVLETCHRSQLLKLTNSVDWRFPHKQNQS